MNYQKNAGKNCGNCAHRYHGYMLDECRLSGYLCSTERKFPNVCGANFEGWVRKPGLLQRIKNYFWG